MDVNRSAADAPTQALPAVRTDTPVLNIPVAGKSEDVQGKKASTHKTLWIVLASVLGLLVLLVAAAFLAGQFFLSQRAPMGVSFAGQSVAGKSADELEGIVNSKVANTKFALTSSNGKSTQATYKDLGVKVDVKGTVNSLLNARGNNPFAKVNPFAGPNVGLKTTTDVSALQTYLNKNLVAQDAQVILPSVSYDPANNSFVVTPGRDGQVISSKSTQKVVNASFTEPAATTSVKVEMDSQKAPISEQVAQDAAAQANARLGKTIRLTNGNKKAYVVLPSQIGAWTKFDADTDKGTISVTYDEASIKSFLEQTLPAQLKQEKVDQENLVSPQGRTLLVKNAGANGVEVKDLGNVVTQVSTALKNDQNLEATPTVEVTKFTTKNTPVPSNFGVPNGDPWLQVDLTHQKVTAYRGTTVVNTFNVATGKASAGHPSDAGTFYVYSKPLSQTMRGPGYVTPGVKWISYYNGGEGFHAAPWNLSNIAAGVATSHGCINMVPSDAEWVYNFAPIGTKVEVIGSTPSGAVR